MKQRLLLSLLMLFVSVGLIQGADIKVTSNGKTAVTITVKGGVVTSKFEANDDVKVNSDKTVVTIAKDYTSKVSIETQAAVTEVSFSGEMADLDINGGSALTTINFGSSKVGTLKVTGQKIAALNCNNLGLTKLILDTTTYPLAQLTEIDASDNALKTGGIENLAGLAKLQELDLSGTEYSGNLDLSSLKALTKLDVSDNDLERITLPSDGKLTSVNLDGNQIKTATIPDGCKADWGTQTTSVTLSENFIRANIGVNVADLIKNARIKNADGTAEIKADKIKVVSWQVLDGTEYKADNNKTAHQQSGYPTNYLFYDTDKENLYVDGTYQCTLNYDGRDYAIQGITVSPAKVDLKIEVPSNVNKVTVSVKNAHAFTQTGVLEGLEQGSTIHVAVEPKAGYEDVTYDVVGLSSGSQKPPYSGKNIDLTVAAKFGSDPKLSVSVGAGGHKVVYDNKNVIGGNFTIQKISEGKTVDLPSNGTISTGEELVVKIYPETNNFRLLINEEDKTNDCTSNPDGNYVYSQKITAEDYKDNKDISVVVTFTSSVTVSAKVDGESLSKSDKLPKGTVAISGATTGTEEVILGTDYKETGNLVPNASYKVRFTLGKEYRLKDNKITVNGGSFDSCTKEETEDGIVYNVIITVKESNITLSISTVKLSDATINITSLLQEDFDNDSQMESVQRQTYDGNAKPVLYTTTPANLKVEVNYKSQDKNTDYEDKAPTDTGAYFVTLSLADNDIYTAKEQPVYLIIEPATPEIKKLPTVTVSEDGKSYEYTGGEVLFNGKTVDGDWAFDTDKLNPSESHTTTATFIPDNKNLAKATASVDVLIDGKAVPAYSIKMNTLPSGYAITWYNGAKVIDISKDKVAKDTELTAVVTYPKGTKDVTLKATTDLNINQPKLSTTESEDGRNVYTFTLTKESVYNEVTFEVVAGTGNQYTIVLDVDNHNNLYTGEPQEYEMSKVRVYDINKQLVELSTLDIAVTYKSGSAEISKPIDAGTYSVTVTIAANAEKGYIESSVTKADAFTIEKIEASVSQWPTASVIAKGMPLSVSDLVNGAANVEGTFEWVDKETVLEKSGTYDKYYVKFIPSKAYETNYTEVISDDPVKVTVSDLQIVAFSQPAEGTIEVSKNGTVITTSDPIVNGDKLAITVTPKTDWEVTSITVNGQSCSFTQSNGKYVASYTVGEVSAAIEATFKAKSTEVTDPNSQYKVTVTESVRGAIISKPGDNVVKLGSDFDFTVSTLAADASKVVVKVDGTTLKPTNGKYVIQDVKKNTTVTVSLPNPTPLKVEVQKDYLNANKYHIGQVEIIDGEATSYYYGDVITVMADPEDGVKFVKWSDGSTDKIHEITLKADTKVVATFSGVPTGIEDIESAAIYTGKGFILVKNVANAKATVVSISGRLQAQETVSGDTRIDVPQGIYVVVLESGSDVKRVKVIVK